MKTIITLTLIAALCYASIGTRDFMSALRYHHAAQIERAVDR